MGNNPRCLTFHLHRRICSEGDRNNNEDGSKACLSFAGFICRTIEWKISEERKRVFQQSSLYKQREETVTKSIFDEGWTTTTTRLDCMIAWLTITDSDDGKSGKRKKKSLWVGCVNTSRPSTCDFSFFNRRNSFKHLTLLSVEAIYVPKATRAF